MSLKRLGSSSSFSSSSFTAIIFYSNFKCKATLNRIRYHYFKPIRYISTMLCITYGVFYTMMNMEPYGHNKIAHYILDIYLLCCASPMVYSTP